MPVPQEHLLISLLHPTTPAANIERRQHFYYRLRRLSLKLYIFPARTHYNPALYLC
jgi:hypothetical protein